jgi:Lrp/AsnC family leucine-responsive transcriptional regulator
MDESRTAAAYAFDAVDRQIVAMLKDNGRVTNRDIARELGITRANVGSRVARMTEAGALRIVAATDFAAYGYDVLLAIGVEVQGRPAEAVAEDLALLPEVFAVHLVTGARELEILVAAHSFAELSNRIVDDIARIEGIRSLDVGIAADIVKYQFDVGISR